MANELKHGSVGTELTQAEWEAVGAHVVANQAVGDLIYADTTSQLLRLGIGSTNDVLRVASGKPDWQATSFITSLGTIATGVWQGTDVGVAYGGTGVSTLTANGVLVGNGASAITSVDMSTKGHVLIGDGSGNPQMLGVGTNTHVLTADSGETTGVKWAAPAAAAAGSLTGSTLASGVTASSLTTVGTLTGLTFAVATAEAGGIVFGVDTNLYRSAANTLKTDDGFRVGASLHINNHVNTADNVMSFNSSHAAPVYRWYKGADDMGGTKMMELEADGDLNNLTGVYGSLSDERIKQNIVNANSQWDDIKALRIVNYKRRQDVIDRGADNASVHLGVVAQELQATSPNLVKEGDATGLGGLHNDFKAEDATVLSVKYSILFLKATKALQEAMARIEALEAKVAVLEA